MKLNLIEAVVLWVIVLCCFASMVDSFLDIVVPLPAQQRQAQVDETLELFRAFDLAPRQVSR